MEENDEDNDNDDEEEDDADDGEEEDDEDEDEEDDDEDDNEEGKEEYEHQNKKRRKFVPNGHSISRPSRKLSRNDKMLPLLMERCHQSTQNFIGMNFWIFGEVGRRLGPR
ncbi:hypothetical protein H5410_023483 [Solanum commersonii]|uniref:Uncharacterized protein n=1 Tax=Solanum commersonii TaxID=4109 RepID=A0A9J5ZHP6_SOLCO|nr:hypothetical protein H5410_023483 [Solanum commersonii]